MATYQQSHRFPAAALEELASIRRMRRPLLGEISGGVVRALSNQEDSIRRRIGCLSIGDAVEHLTDVEISGDPCNCRTCGLAALMDAWR